MADGEELYGQAPNYQRNRLWDTVGYCDALWVEQEDGRDSVRFTLSIWTERYEGPLKRNFILPLDSSTTVVLLQFQLLADALRSGWDAAWREAHPLLVRVHFNFDADATNGWVYWLAVYGIWPEETTVQAFYNQEGMVFYSDPVVGREWYTRGALF